MKAHLPFLFPGSVDEFYVSYYFVMGENSQFCRNKKLKVAGVETLKVTLSGCVMASVLGLLQGGGAGASRRDAGPSPGESSLRAGGMEGRWVL